mmetsp:Transcript_37760/g.108577  ORF Transcript_37760/g.108577 Transcript_37760/m.108577 type:complete len:212 (+) Transcript_37760:1321-1956(+)
MRPGELVAVAGGHSGAADAVFARWNVDVEVVCRLEPRTGAREGSDRGGVGAQRQEVCRNGRSLPPRHLVRNSLAADPDHPHHLAKQAQPFLRADCRPRPRTADAGALARNLRQDAPRWVPEARQHAEDGRPYWWRADECKVHHALCRQRRRGLRLRQAHVGRGRRHDARCDRGRLVRTADFERDPNRVGASPAGERQVHAPLPVVRGQLRR